MTKCDHRTVDCDRDCRLMPPHVHECQAGLLAHRKSSPPVFLVGVDKAEHEVGLRDPDRKGVPYGHLASLVCCCQCPVGKFESAETFSAGDADTDGFVKVLRLDVQADASIVNRADAIDLLPIEIKDVQLFQEAGG